MLTQHPNSGEDNLAAKSPQWRLRYLVAIPVVAAIYSFVMFAILLSGLGNGPPPIWNAVGCVLAFPLLYASGGGPWSTDGTIALLLCNGSIWGVFVTAIWHVSYIIRGKPKKKLW